MDWYIHVLLQLNMEFPCEILRSVSLQPSPGDLVSATESSQQIPQQCHGILPLRGLTKLDIWRRCMILVGGFNLEIAMMGTPE